MLALLLLKIGSALVTGLAQGSMIALVALGYTMVYGVLKLINFAHSEVFMAGGHPGRLADGAPRRRQEPAPRGAPRHRARDGGRRRARDDDRARRLSSASRSHARLARSRDAA